jgi:hypothetical protein
MTTQHLGHLVVSFDGEVQYARIAPMWRVWWVRGAVGLRTLTRLTCLREKITLADYYAWPCYSDCGNSVVYDPALGRYVAFGRFGLTRLADGGQFALGRNVARVTSEDFLHWSEPEMVLCVDARDPDTLQINDMAVELYEGVYIGLMELFVLTGTDRSRPIQLAASRDGLHWTRVADRFDFFDRGDPGQWDDAPVHRPSALMLHDDRVLMYYTSGSGQSHFSGIGLATWRRDGFVSLHAGPDGGDKPVSGGATAVPLKRRDASRNATAASNARNSTAKFMGIRTCSSKAVPDLRAQPRLPELTLSVG